MRYYEKIGPLPSPVRDNGKQVGVRRYNDEDVRLIRFIHGLKETGMKLEEIAAFSEDGCLLAEQFDEAELEAILRKRTDMLDRHIERLERRLRQLKEVKEAAVVKRSFYEKLLQKEDFLVRRRIGNVRSRTNEGCM